MSESDGFAVAEDAYRYSASIRAGDAPSNGTRLEHSVMIMCDSATGNVHWWNLVVKHRRGKGRRIRCPDCWRMATVERITSST